MGQTDAQLERVQAAIDELFIDARAAIFVNVNHRVTGWHKYVPGNMITCPIDAAEAWVVVVARGNDAQVWTHHLDVRAGTSFEIPKAVVTR